MGSKPQLVHKAALFKYSLRIKDAADLDRAFAAGRPIETTGLDLELADTQEYHKELHGNREYAELLRKSIGSSTASLILARCSAGEDGLDVFGEVYLVLKDVSGRVVDRVLVDQFECGDRQYRRFALGWYEQAIHCTSSATDMGAVGISTSGSRTLKFASISHFNLATDLELSADSIEVDREATAIPTVWEGDMATMSLCSKTMVEQ